MLTFHYPADWHGLYRGGDPCYFFKRSLFPSLLFKNRTDKMFDSSFTDGERVIKEKRKLSFVHLGHT